MVRRFKCDFLILCETKLVSPSPALLRSIGGGRLNNWEVLPSQGASRGIIIGWNSVLCDKVDQCRGSFSLSVKMINQEDNLEWWRQASMDPAQLLSNLIFWQSCTIFIQWYLPIGYWEGILIFPDILINIRLEPGCPLS